MRWTLVGFRHPDNSRSLIYKQGMSQEGLVKAIEEGAERGCNLFSIRGFKEVKE